MTHRNLRHPNAPPPSHSLRIGSAAAPRTHAAGVLFTVRADFDCEAEDDDELTFRAGDLLDVVADEGEWLIARPHGSVVAPKNVPSSYVTKI